MFERFKHRSHEFERLDTGEYTPGEYARWQREMKFIHGIFGEERALKNTLLRDIVKSGARRVSVLDVGAGSGGLLRQLNKWTADRETFLVGAELDAIATRSINGGSINGIQCDALNMPFADGSFDYVFCSLFLHHLDDVLATKLIKEMARVAAKRIYVIDLNRHPVAFYAYRFFGWFVLQRFTLEDGALSILRSRTPGELIEVGKKAGLSELNVVKSRANRLVLSGTQFHYNSGQLSKMDSFDAK